MSATEDPDLVAAEYVLGTLDDAERAAADARRGSDAAFALAVAAWERRLAPLSEAPAEAEPPSGLLTAIMARLPLPGVATGRAAAEIADLRMRLRRWRTGALTAGALAAALAVAVGLEAVRPVGEPSRYVAVLQKDATSPAFMLTVDLVRKTFSVRPVAAPPMHDHDYELWMVDAQRPPQSLGVLNDRSPMVNRRLPYPSAMLQSATYAVTMEPQGGSPTGKPTGPVVYSGHLMQAPP